MSVNTGVAFREPCDGNSLSDLFYGLAHALIVSAAPGDDDMLRILRVLDSQQIRNLGSQVESVRSTLLGGVSAMAALAAEAESIASRDRESAYAVRQALLLIQELTAAVEALDYLGDLAKRGRPMVIGGGDAP